MYGLKIGDSTEKDLQTASKAGFNAYAWLVTHKETRGKIISIIKKQNFDMSDTVVDDIMHILEEDILAHDYDPDKAWNEEAMAQMSVESYILSRTRYAILTYQEQTSKRHRITVKNGDKKQDLYVKTISLDAPVGQTDGTGESTRHGMVADVEAETTLDSVLSDTDIDNLVERITRFAAWSDTNIDVVIYATTCLDLWCDKYYDETTAIKQVLSALGITNYVSMKEFIHNEEFIEVYKEASAVTNKQLLAQKLAKNIFCVKEITQIIHWIAEEINKTAK